MSKASLERADGVSCKPEARHEPIFREVNPEAVTPTAFYRGLPKAGGRANLVESQVISEEVKMKAIEKLLQSCSRRHKQPKHRRPSKPRPLARAPKEDAPIMTRVVPLANPRGVRTICEMCSLPGRLCCVSCGVTYYCGRLHRRQDVLHERLCQRIGIIRGMSRSFASKEDRFRGLAQKTLVTTSLLEEIFCNAIENLYKDDVETAAVEFRICLTLMPDVYGPHSCEGLTLFIFMSESFIKKRQLAQACQCIALATYELRKLEEESGDPSSLSYTKSLLFKVQGKVDMEEQHFQDAAFHFAECVYFSAEAFGGYHVRVCLGYFNLGQALIASHKRIEGFSTLGFCADLWTAYLEEQFLASVPEDSDPLSVVFTESVKNNVPRCLQLEGYAQLNGIEAIFRKAHRPLSAALLKTGLCLAILDFLQGKYTSAKNRAEDVFEPIMEHDNPKLKYLVKRVRRLAARRQTEEVASKKSS